MSQADSASAPRVLVEFQVEGGLAYIPALSRPVTIDTDDLDPADGARLRALLDGAGFFTRPAEEGVAAPGAADYRTYVITVTGAGQSHTVRATEPIDDPALRSLVDQLVAWQRSRL